MKQNSAPFLRGDVSNFLYESVNALSSVDGVDFVLNSISTLLESEMPETESETLHVLFGAIHIAMTHCFPPPGISPEGLSALSEEGARILASAGGESLAAAGGVRRVLDICSDWPVQLSIETVEEVFFYLLYGVAALRAILTLPPLHESMDTTGTLGVMTDKSSLVLQEFLDAEDRLTVVFTLMGFSNATLEFE